MTQSNSGILHDNASDRGSLRYHSTYFFHNYHHRKRITNDEDFKMS